METVSYTHLYHINEEYLPVLCASVLPSLEEFAILKKPDSLERYLPKPCEILVYLDYVDRTLTASIYSQYGDARYNLCLLYTSRVKK